MKKFQKDILELAILLKRGELKLNLIFFQMQKEYGSIEFYHIKAIKIPIK